MAIEIGESEVVAVVGWKDLTAAEKRGRDKPSNDALCAFRSRDHVLFLDYFNVIDDPEDWAKGWRAGGSIDLRSGFVTGDVDSSTKTLRVAYWTDADVPPDMTLLRAVRVLQPMWRHADLVL